MNIRRAVQDAIKEKLTEAVNDMNWDDIIDRIADGAIEYEIGDIEEDAEQYICAENADCESEYGAREMLHDLIDEALD